MSRALDDLSSQFRPIVFEVLARLTEAGLAVMIVDTLRTEAEHQANLAAGTSTAKLSFHLPRHLRLPLPPPLTDPDRAKSDAIDLAPFAQWQLHGPDKLQWDPADPAWKVIGRIGEGLGLEWGGRWTRPHDPGHLQLPRARWTA